MERQITKEASNMDTKQLILGTQKFFIGIAIALTILWVVKLLTILGYQFWTMKNMGVALGVIGFAYAYMKLAK